MAENIEVTHLGEDGDFWLVTGTTDAHSAEEAIRKIDRELGTYLEDGVPMIFVYRKSWAWEPGPSADDPMDEARLVHGIADSGAMRFAGYLVTL